MLNLNYKDMQNNMMHIGFRKDFSKKRRVLVEGAWGGVRDKYKVGSLNYFCILATYLFNVSSTN